MAARSEHTPTTNERLLSTAAELFWEKGFAGTSTRELAERLGIQKASLYYHIRSKEDLLYDISIQSLDRMQQAVFAAVARAGFDERMPALIHAHLTTALTDRDMHATMLTELRALSTERREAVLARRANYESLVLEILKAEQEAGRLRADLDPSMLTMSLLNLVNWTIFSYRPGGGQSIDQLADFFCEMFMEGASARTA